MKEQVLEISKYFDPLEGLEYDIVRHDKGATLLSRIVEEPDDLIRLENILEVEEIFGNDIDNNFANQIDYIKEILSLKKEQEEEVMEILHDNVLYDPLDLFLQRIEYISFVYKTGMNIEYSSCNYLDSNIYKKKFFDMVQECDLLDNIGYKYLKTLSESGLKGEVVFLFKLDKESIKNIIQNNCDIEFSKIKIGIVDYDDGVSMIISDVINQNIRVPFNYDSIIVDDARGEYAATAYNGEDFLQETLVKVISND